MKSNYWLASSSCWTGAKMHCRCLPRASRRWFLLTYGSTWTEPSLVELESTAMEKSTSTVLGRQHMCVLYLLNPRVGSIWCVRSWVIWWWCEVHIGWSWMHGGISRHGWASCVRVTRWKVRVNICWSGFLREVMLLSGDMIRPWTAHRYRLCVEILLFLTLSSPTKRLTFDLCGRYVFKRRCWFHV